MPNGKLDVNADGFVPKGDWEPVPIAERYTIDGDVVHYHAHKVFKPIRKPGADGKPVTVGHTGVCEHDYPIDWTNVTDDEKLMIASQQIATIPKWDEPVETFSVRDHLDNRNKPGTKSSVKKDMVEILTNDATPEEQLAAIKKRLGL